jgi:SAM-dependent methyltransferase
MQIDANEFRERQRQDWDTASAGWHAWDEPMSRWTRPVSERMIEMAGVKPGDRVLDVACGLGEPALTAAHLVGPEGHIIATDISSRMIAHGRERAAAAGLDNIRVPRVRRRVARLPHGELRRRALALGDHLRARRRGHRRAHPGLPEGERQVRDQLLGPA